MRWPPERIDRMRALAAEGWSVSQIATEFGDGVSRNAVIGVCFRNGIQLLGNSFHSAAPAQPPKKARAENPIAPVVVKEPPKPEPAIDLSMFGPLDGAPTAILSLTSRSCRFPIGEPSEPTFMFCGVLEADMLTVPPRPYCRACAKKLRAGGSAGKTQSAETIAKRKRTMARKSVGRAAA